MALCRIESSFIIITEHIVRRCFEVIGNHFGIGDINKLIQEHNETVRRILAEDERERKAIQDEKDSLDSKKKTLSSFRSNLIRLEYQRRILKKKADLLTSFISQERERLSRYTQEQEQIRHELKKSEQSLSELQPELAALGILDKKKKEALQKQISTLEDKIQNLQSHEADLLTKYQFRSTSDVEAAQETLQNRELESEELQQSLTSISNKISDTTNQYMAIYNSLSEEEKVEIIEELIEEPVEPEVVYVSTQKDHLDDAIFSAAIDSVNQMLRLSRDTYRMVQTKVRRERRR